MNSISIRGEKEYQDRGKCACGGSEFEDIYYCINDHGLCRMPWCDYSLTMKDCEFFKIRIRCKSCGEIQEER